MESVSDGCPTGILVDIGLETKVLNNAINKNEENQSTKSKKNNIANALHKITSDCILDQSPLRHPPVLRTNRFFTPKSSWKTPSPKSMKIIKHDTSRIINQLHASPVNCSEVMIFDEVFPAVKSFDYDLLDDCHIQSKDISAADVTCTDETVDLSNPNSLDLANCTISAFSSSENVAASDEKLSTVEILSEIKPATSERINEMDSLSENEPYYEACAETLASDEVKSVSYAEISSPAVSETSNTSSHQLIAAGQKITTHKKMSLIGKGFGFKMSLNRAEKNTQSDGTRQVKYERKFVKSETSCDSLEDNLKDTKITRNQILKNESMLMQSSKKYVAAKNPIVEKKNGKENQNLKMLSQTLIGKPKSNAKRSQSLLFKKDPLYKTEPSLETTLATSSIRRINSFHAGASKNAVPTVEKNTPTTDSRSRFLKPMMPLNQVSTNGNGYSTPLQFRRFSQTFKPPDLSITNAIQKKSFAFNANCSLNVSDIKDEHSIAEKSSLTSSSRLRFVKKINATSTHPKFKKDSLPRKLFP